MPEEHACDGCFQKSVEELTKKIDTYIENDIKRYEKLLDLRAADSQILGRVMSSIDSLCDWANETKQLTKDVSANKSTLKVYGWLIKTIAGFLVFAGLGGGVAGITSCPEQDSDHLQNGDQNGQSAKRHR